MNINTSPDLIGRSTVGITPGYMSGFGNSFETEAHLEPFWSAVTRHRSSIMSFMPNSYSEAGP